MKLLQAEEIFHRALEFSTAGERSKFLVSACGSDTALREKVEHLIAAHEASSEFLSTQPGTITLQFPLSEKPGERIGRYKLLQQIGEGGMGVVYMAEQEEPVRRRVALKIIKLGMDTRQVVARFEAERQALALMDHPNIAKVLDGGATETGRPYFVMELVQGVPITDFCDKTKLSAKERLKLFIQVCQAVQHAHQKGIIHRDIKPSNVLVTLHDGVPVPKVIDFGIAKATNQKLTEKTLFTNFATMIGTPAYMSPEQAEMSGLDIDTRTDIYALGVLLYALLTGTTPFPEKRLRSLGYGEMQRVILEEEPERPSTRLSTMANEQKTLVARNCSEDLASLSNLLRGDLDWIEMKCLEKDRQRRYETASGLANDIQRHLGSEPVVARPPSAAYRFQKMVKRNRTVAFATAAVAGAMILAAVFSTSAFLRERKARLHAAVAEKAREEERQAKQVETVRADTVAKFVTGFFDAVIPDLDQRGHFDAIRNLLIVADRFTLQLTNAPAAEAEIRFNIGEGYSINLHEYEPSKPQYQAIERIGPALGKRGEHLALFARSHLAAMSMFEGNDTNRHLALQQIGKEALAKTPPDTEVAASAFEDLANHCSYSRQDAKAETLAGEILRFAPNDALHFSARMGALEILVRMCSTRGASVEAEDAADQLLSPLEVSEPLEGLQRQRSFQTLVATLRDGDRFRIPEKSLWRALEKLPKQDLTARGYIQGLLGAVIARSGDWRKGLNLLHSSVTNSYIDVGLWHNAANLASLIDDTDMRRSLFVYGLAKFASGAEPETSRVLVEPLLIFPPDASFLPVISDLVARIPQGPIWTRSLGLIPLALFEYHTGHYREAASNIEKFLAESENMAGVSFDPYWAGGWFLRSAIEMRLNHPEQARAAYRRGLGLHSPALRAPGTAYTDNEWGAACTAELLRRNAVALLGDATPPDAPVLNKP